MIVFHYSVTPSTKSQFVKMPKEAQVLHVAERTPGDIRIWAKVGEAAPLVLREVWLVGTGWYVPWYTDFVGTVHVDGLVFHLFTGYEEGIPEGATV